MGGFRNGGKDEEDLGRRGRLGMVANEQNNDIAT